MSTVDLPNRNTIAAWRRSHERKGWVYVLPALALFAVMVAYPLLRSFYLSFFDYYLLEPEATKFVGFHNYERIFTERVNRQPFWNTLYFTAIFVPPYVLLSLAVAMMLNRLRRGATFLRTMIFTPVVVSMAVSAVLWTMFYNSTYGMGQHVLTWLHVAPKDGVLGASAWAMPGIALMCLWNGIAINIILFLVGLERIPEEIYEAAVVDGASSWQRFRHVTLPLLKPTIFLVVLLSLIGALKIFGQPYIMTGGGPKDSTMTYVMRLYNLAFRTRTFDLGYASALAYALAVFIFILSMILRRFTRSAE